MQLKSIDIAGGIRIEALTMGLHHCTQSQIEFYVAVLVNL